MSTEPEAKQQQQQQQEPVYEDVSAEQGVTEIESLCVACHEMGHTRLLLTRVPHFREIILMAFSCPHCGYENTDVQSGATIQKFGVRYTLSVAGPKDMNRQIVKGDAASIVLPHLEFEIPAGTQRGSLNTLEGFLRQAASGLGQLQDERRKESPEIAEKIDSIIAELLKCAGGECEFTVVVDDPSGNCFVENPRAPAEDPQLHVLHYRRSKAQNHALSLFDQDEIEGPGQISRVEEERQEEEERKKAAEDEKKAAEEDKEYLRLVPAHKTADRVTMGLPSTHDRASVTQDQEVFTIQDECPMCSATGEMRSVLTKIPFFKEVIIMAFTCDRCGYKSNTVQPGGAIPAHGTRLVLRVQEPLDMTRSFLKSETSTLEIPELQLELGPGTLGSRFTSVEGIIEMVHDEMQKNAFMVGDSASAEMTSMRSLITRLEELRTGNTKFTLIVDDPMSNSYIQNPLAPEKDPQLDVVEYERTWQQNEDLGLNDMHTELDPVTGQYVAAKPPSLPHN